MEKELWLNIYYMPETSSYKPGAYTFETKQLACKAANDYERSFKNRPEIYVTTVKLSFTV